MNGNDTALIITALGTLVSALLSGAAMVISALNSRRLKEQGVVIEATHQATNSKMTQLTEEVRTAARALGMKEGRAEMAESIATATPVIVAATKVEKE